MSLPISITPSKQPFLTLDERRELPNTTALYVAATSLTAIVLMQVREGIYGGV